MSRSPDLVALVRHYLRARPPSARANEGRAQTTLYPSRHERVSVMAANKSVRAVTAAGRATKGP